MCLDDLPCILNATENTQPLFRLASKSYTLMFKYYLLFLAVCVHAMCLILNYIIHRFNATFLSQHLVADLFASHVLMYNNHNDITVMNKNDNFLLRSI